MSQPIAALIIARPGPLRYALYRLLKAAARIAHVACTDTLPPAQTSSAPLSLIVLDCDLPDSVSVEALQQMKHARPALCWIALVDNEQQACMARHIGVDRVLLKGMLATRLLAAIEALLPE